MRILVVDDERLSRRTAVRQLSDAGFVADSAPNGFAALETLEEGLWDVVLCDLCMPGMDGLELLRKLRREAPHIDVLVMTAYATVETAVEAMQAGAADYLTKPFAFEELELRLRKLAELRDYRVEVKNLRALLETGDSVGIVGNCAGMREVLDRIRMYSQHDAPLLITGETGTGKEVAARAIHKLSARSTGPFVALGCGAIPKTLAESELFGHERGAFTGATGRRIGAFERAHGGTLLLDDIDDLPLDLQASLLRALQESTFARVGGGREIHVDVRVIATTKENIPDLVERGEFRADLFYRLRGLEILLPPLRDRGDDILLLAQHFLQLSAKAGAGRRLTPAAASCLRSYPWPGNVRELRHAIGSALVVCGGDCVDVGDLPEYLRVDSVSERNGGVFRLNLDGREEVPFSNVIAEVEDELITWAMRRAGGQQKAAAALLGLPRTTFQSKLRRYGDRRAD